MLTRREFVSTSSVFATATLTGLFPVPGHPMLLLTLFSIPCHWLFVLSSKVQLPLGIDGTQKGEQNMKLEPVIGSLPPRGHHVGCPPADPWSF